MKRSLLLIATVIPLMAFSACPLFASGVIPTGKIELVGHVGGVAAAVATQGDYLYAGFGSEMAILDISNPVLPERVGYVMLPGIVEDVVVAGSLAYVSLARNRLFTYARLLVIDVSDPRAPFEIPEMAMEGEHVTIVPGGPREPIYAYVGFWNKLKVMDVSDRGIPEEVGSYDSLGMLAMDAVVIDAYAYVLLGYWYRGGSRGGGSQSGVKVLDVTDPAALREVGSISGPAPPAFVGDDVAFAAVDNGLYVGTCRDGVYVVDISDPINPVHVGNLGYAEARVIDIVVADDLAYAVYDDGTLSVLDISNPVHPSELGARRVLSAGIMDIVVVGDYIYAAGGDGGGLQVVDVSNPVVPIVAGGCGIPGRAERFVVADGDRAYLINSEGALWIVDVSDSGFLAPVGRYPYWGKGRGLSDLVVIDGYVYAATEVGLQVANVSDLTDLKEMQFGATSALAQARDPTGHTHLYVATTGDSRGDGDTEILRVLDVSDPIRPQEVGQATFIDPKWWWPHVQDIFVADNGYAYAAGMRELWVVDVSNAADPLVVGGHDTPGAAHAVAVAGGHVYVADGFSGLRLLDISDPASPVDAGHVGVAGLTVDVAVGNGCVYVVNEQEGLWVWDISDPAHPANPRNFYIPGRPVQVAVAGDLVYVLDAVGGMYVLRVK